MPESSSPEPEEVEELPLDSSGSDADPPSGFGRWKWLGFDLFVAAAVVVGATYVAGDIITSKPRPKRVKSERRAKLVEVTTVSSGQRRVEVEAAGEVRPARTIDVRPQVTGRVKQRNTRFEVGSLLATGETLVRVDSADYVIALRKARAALIQAQADLKLARGSHRLAKREFKMLGEDPKADTELVLRKPQLAAAKARVAAASADVAQAKLQLERMTIVAPFDAVVRSRAVEVGSHISPAGAVAKLVGTDRWWVEVRLPNDQLRWLNVGDETGAGGSLARIYNPEAWGKDIYRTARVARVAPDVEQGGRMARVLLAVDDPMGRKDPRKPPLKLNAYVRVIMEGLALNDVIPLARGLLREEDTVWVMLPDDTLAIRKVVLAYAGRDEVLVLKGLSHGERVVTTPLGSPVPGMALRVRTTESTRQKAAHRPSGRGPGT